MSKSRKLVRWLSAVLAMLALMSVAAVILGVAAAMWLSAAAVCAVRSVYRK